MAVRAQRLRESVRLRRIERQTALRQPDFYTNGGGQVHPIRNSPGYDPLREREGEHHRHLEESLRRDRAHQRSQDVERSYRELQNDIRAEGGIRPTRDYPAVDIPLDVRRHEGHAPDLMAATLEARGWHFRDADDMLAQLKARRRHLEASGRLQRA